MPRSDPDIADATQPTPVFRRRKAALAGLVAFALAIGVSLVLAHGSSPTVPTAGSASIPSHIETWAYDDGCNGGAGASASLVRRWVTYAESHCGRGTKVLSDCHAPGVTYCTALQYLDASNIYRIGSLPVAQDAPERWWLHLRGYKDAVHRLTLSSYGGGNQLNQAIPGVDAWFQSYVHAHYNAYDALMMDDTAAGLSAQFGGVATDEIRTDGDLQAAHQQLATAITHADGTPFLQIDNGIKANSFLASSIALLDRPAAVQGLVDEGDPEDDGTMPNPEWGYPTLLDDMAYVDHIAHDFEVLLSYDPRGSLPARRVQAATILLGYARGHVVSWSDLEQDNIDLAVWPEEGIVPTIPLQSMSEPSGPHCLDGTGPVCIAGGHNDVEVAPGIYRREFGACYDQSTPFGDCAVIVNTTRSEVTVRRAWLKQSYGHQITMIGGDVQSGGTVDLHGAGFIAGSTAVGAQDAMLLAG